MIADSVAFLIQHVEEVVYDAEHYFDGFKRDREYALETLRVAERAGASCLVLCDTNGGSLPSEVAEIVRDTRRHVRSRSGSTRTTTASARSRTRWPRSSRARSTSRAR